MRTRIIAVISAIGILAAASASALAREEAHCTGPCQRIRNLVLTEERVRSFGDYRAIAHPSLVSGDTVHIYGEPEDFGWHERNGTARFNVVADVELRSRDGRRVAGRSDPRPMTHEAAARPGKFFFSLSLIIRLPVGEYRLVLRLRDAVTGELVEKSFPFSIAARRLAPSARLQPERAPAKDDPPANGECKKYLPQLGKVIAVPCG